MADEFSQTKRLRELLPLIRELRALGCTKYEDDVFMLEMNASVVVSEDSGISRPMSEDEEEEIHNRVAERRGKERDRDLFGAA